MATPEQYPSIRGLYPTRYLHAITIFSLFLLPLLAVSQNITTIAGTGTGGYNGDGIAATSAQLQGPQGLAFDEYGNIYIADLANSRIRKITISTGMISTIAGTGTVGYNGDGILAVNAQITNPSALVFDGNGDLYFTDRGNNRIRKITVSTGMISTVAGTGTGGYNGDGIAATAAQLSGPNEVAFDANGNLYIADWFNNRVRKVDKITGMISTIAGTGTAGYNGDGIAATAAQINGPCGIIFDITGNIYVVEYTGYRIRKIANGTGLISTIAGTGTAGYNGDGIPATTAQLNGCAYITFDAVGNIYIGDAINQRVRKIAVGTGIITTIAGTGTGGYNGDGIAAASAQLNAPFYIYFDQLNCNMYIADYNNNRIRKITGGFTGCPVPVAKGNLVSCQVLPAVTIGPANNNTWVPVFDSTGNIAAMINAGGNNLGMVSTSLFTKNGACRLDGSQRIYLNRNITITPQNQPSSGTVNLRLYLLQSELDSLKTATNSLGQPSGVFSINDVSVFKNNDACATLGSNTALPLSTVAASYNTDYYLQAGVSSFSSFYFADNLYSSVLPVQVSLFTGERIREANLLKWEAGCNGQPMFTVERSYDGMSFEDIGTIISTESDCNTPFGFTDNNASSSVSYYYYRLKISQAGKTVNYSSTILLHGDRSGTIQLSISPSLVSGSVIHLQVSAENAGQMDLFVCDVMGHIISRRSLAIQAGGDHSLLDAGTLAPGIYWLYGIGKEGRTNVLRFVKE